MSQTPVVTVRHLNHAFGRGELRKPVLFDVDLDISTGEIVLLTGPSGSGKTTLLTLIAGLRSVQDGSVKILGQELFGANKQQLVQVRNQIGFIATARLARTLKSRHAPWLLAVFQNSRVV
ncbi:ATP-binding cassette domain-containing protein, partial [Mastigocoleus testarum]|uniref:ATP-binding cassette domain-containing protein n=1 Tax=Mastigocoleus testarum TaxID=996925 RepID=UPI0019108CDB